jgi:hypothetical protein
MSRDVGETCDRGSQNPRVMAGAWSGQDGRPQTAPGVQHAGPGDDRLLGTVPVGEVET